MKETAKAHCPLASIERAPHPSPHARCNIYDVVDAVVVVVVVEEEEEEEEVAVAEEEEEEEERPNWRGT